MYWDIQARPLLAFPTQGPTSFCRAPCGISTGGIRAFSLRTCYFRVDSRAHCPPLSSGRGAELCSPESSGPASWRALVTSCIPPALLPTLLWLHLCLNRHSGGSPWCRGIRGEGYGAWAFLVSPARPGHSILSIQITLPPLWPLSLGIRCLQVIWSL